MILGYQVFGRTADEVREAAKREARAFFGEGDYLAYRVDGVQYYEGGEYIATAEAQVVHPLPAGDDWRWV